MSVNTFAILIAISIFLFIIELIRRHKMTFKYSLFWLTSSILVIFFACHPNLLSKLSSLAGFALTSNFIFFLSLVFFIILCLLLSVYANEQNNRGETLAQAVGILEHRIKKLEEKKEH